MHVLFLCSRNQWRSPTGEAVFRRLGIDARSAGTSAKARHAVTAADVTWADVIYAMEPKHKRRLRAMFPRATQYKRIVVLDIPDEYRFMDPELVAMLEVEARSLASQ